MPDQFTQAINDATIRRLAGEQAYQRGLDYFSHGHVESLEERDGTLHAVVRGSQNYAVTLANDDGVPDYSCDCPAASDGDFCKHCAAAALAWLSRSAQPAKSSGRQKAKEVTLADAGKILQAEDKDAIIKLVLDWAKDDARLHQRLILYAARRSGPYNGSAAVRQAFEKAVRVSDYVSYREASGWAQGVDDAIDSVEQLLNDGQPAAAIELCESALQSLLGAIESVDDSDGHFDALRDRLQDIHYRACDEARPDPAELACRLFHCELHSDYDVFSDAAAQYAAILGPVGLKVYRELAEAEWEKVPARAAGAIGSQGGNHFRITQIMESLARASGDIGELVTVMSKDLSHALRYLTIAVVCREARQWDSALLWAEKGLHAFPDGADARLREFAAEEYHRRGRHDDAMKLMWAVFLERPGLETYKVLEKHAKQAGAWQEWRERALAEIRLRIAKAREKSHGKLLDHWPTDEGTHSRLAEIFLHEGDAEAAWREGQTGGCSDSLWLRVAVAREKLHPADAAPVYLRLAEASLAAISNGRYEDTVALLAKAASVMKCLDRSPEFVRQLDALRLKYKIKRNFIRLVEQKRKVLYL